MDELTRKMEIARQHVRRAGPWDAEHAALLRIGLERKARRRRVLRASAATLLTVTGLALGAFLLPERQAEVVAKAPVASPAPAPATPVIEPDVLRLGDGSRITPAAGAEVMIRDLTAELVTVEMMAGRSRFNVAPRPERTFAVQTKHVRILVIGTSFTVDEQADRTGVSVHHGRVRVEHDAGTQELTGGETGWFAASRGPPDPPPLRRRTRATVAPKKPEPEAPEAPPEEDEDEDEDEDEVGALLDAADGHRRTGRHAEAVIRLETVVQRHADDARAPLAAFTLGRVLLDLHRAEEAAAAFAQARQLDPTGPLAEDALAREVEAWAAAGRPDETRARAMEYLERYPRGRREPGVRTHLE